MAYLQHTSWKERPGAVAAVIAIHALIGYTLINGLSFVRAIVDNPPLVGETIIDDIPIDPPKPVEDPKTELERTPVAPRPPVDLSNSRPPIDTTPIILPTIDDIPLIVPTTTPPVDVGPKKPAFDPVAPRPRNDPSEWVTTSDYRSSWINREWTGTARVRLEIAASGRVEGCSITRSSGHAELDAATCELIARRARFEPARNGAGEKTGGSYASAVSWQLPR